MDLLAHRLDDLVDAVGDPAGAVAVAARHADHAAGAAHGRSEEAALVVGVADRELDVILAAAVAHRGDAALECRAHELHAAHGELGGAEAVLHDAGIALGAGQRMDMAVDHARDQRAARRVDRLAGKARELSRRRDLPDLAALFEDRVSVQHLLAIEQTAADIQRRHWKPPAMRRALSSHAAASRNP